MNKPNYQNLVTESEVQNERDNKVLYSISHPLGGSQVNAVGMNKASLSVYTKAMNEESIHSFMIFKET